LSCVVRTWEEGVRVCVCVDDSGAERCGR